MKIKSTVLYLLFLINFYTVAQTAENYDFIGTLILENKALITYRIQFDIKDSKVFGYSYTDINGKDETKSELTGHYNSKEKSIFLKESNILYTKSKEIEDIFCFINVNAKLKLEKDKPAIQGEFYGFYNNKDTCATGKILLISLKDAFDKIEEASKKISKTKKIDSITKAKFTKESFLNEIKPNTLKNNDILTVFWKNNKFILEIWDNGKEDGDLISLTFNKKTVFRNYEIKNEKRVVELDLIDGDNLIEILANNNGTIAPNTAKVILIDGSIEHTISTSLESGQSSKINIIYKPE